MHLHHVECDEGQQIHFGLQVLQLLGAVGGEVRGPPSMIGLVEDNKETDRIVYSPGVLIVQQV